MSVHRPAVRLATTMHAARQAAAAGATFDGGRAHAIVQQRQLAKDLASLNVGHGRLFLLCGLDMDTCAAGCGVKVGARHRRREPRGYATGRPPGGLRADSALTR